MDNSNNLVTMMAGLIWVAVVLGVIFYAYAAICMMKIAEKTNTPNAWWAWVPILQIVLLIQVAGKPIWWIILCFLPLVNLIILILIMIGVCEARKKSPALVIGLILPVVNLVVLGYLAFSD
jgi:hypothetical protein